MYTLAQAKDYFATYYAPNNLTGSLVGDFKIAEVKPLLERYFGRIPRGKIEPPAVVTLEPKSLGEQRYGASAETSPTVRIWWKGVPFVHKDAAALDLLSDILSGRTGRLYKGLVLGKQIANEAQASVDIRKYAGIFELESVVKDGKDPAEVEKAIDEEIARIQKDPPSRRRGAPEGQEPVQGKRVPAAFVAVLHCRAAHGLRRARRLEVHQQRGGESRRGDRGRHPARWRRPT
jgi:predicted Zn-dependent peptidase